MKLALVITVIISLIMTVLLIDARNHGLHPNMKAFGIMIPFISLLIWGRVTLATKSN